MTLLALTDAGRRAFAELFLRYLVADRGFGFISAEDEKEYFFHLCALDAALDFDRLRGGEKVDFTIEQSPKGLRANSVRPA